MPTLRKLTTIWVSREGASLCSWKFPRSCAQGRSGGEGLSAGKRPTWRAGAVTRGGDISGQVGKGSSKRQVALFKESSQRLDPILCPGEAGDGAGAATRCSLRAW